MVCLESDRNLASVCLSVEHRHDKSEALNTFLYWMRTRSLQQKARRTALTSYDKILSVRQKVMNRFVEDLQSFRPPKHHDDSPSSSFLTRPAAMQDSQCHLHDLLEGV